MVHSVPGLRIHQRVSDIPELSNLGVNPQVWCWRELYGHKSTPPPQGTVGCQRNTFLQNQLGGQERKTTKIWEAYGQEGTGVRIIEATESTPVSDVRERFCVHKSARWSDRGSGPADWPTGLGNGPCHLDAPHGRYGGGFRNVIPYYKIKIRLKKLIIFEIALKNNLHI